MAVQPVANTLFPYTILPLDWAYSNARLVCRPDSDWLMAQKILQNDAEDD